MTRSSGKFPQTHDTSCFPMLLLAICSPATDFCVLAWCHVGTRQMKPEIWNPSLACCLATQFLDTYLKEMLCKQVEESVSHSGCQVGISSLGACESPTSSLWLSISLPPRTREPSWKEGHSTVISTLFGQCLHLFPGFSLQECMAVQLNRFKMS